MKLCGLNPRLPIYKTRTVFVFQRLLHQIRINFSILMPQKYINRIWRLGREYPVRLYIFFHSIKYVGILSMKKENHLKKK